jgi:hypothetical protein
MTLHAFRRYQFNSRRQSETLHCVCIVTELLTLICISVSFIERLVTWAYLKTKLVWQIFFFVGVNVIQYVHNIRSYYVAWTVIDTVIRGFNLF